mgnify:CR=1 FL=1
MTERERDDEAELLEGPEAAEFDELVTDASTVSADPDGLEEWLVEPVL